MNVINFPEGITWDVNYVTGGDLLPVGYKLTNIGNLWKNCSNAIVKIQVDTSNVTDMSHMFMSCANLKTISQMDTSKVTNMNNMFYSCGSLISIPQMDTSKVTSMSYMLSDCEKLTSIPQLDTSEVTNMGNMFSDCKSLTSIPLLNCGSVTSTTTPIGYSELKNLTDLGGFKDLKISWTSSFLDKCPNLTTESLMNVINNLYDLTANGLSGKTLKFGTTNLNKLTSDQIAVATNKGWTLI